MSQQLSVLIAASESTPIVKVGGIADVVGSLPAALQQHDVDARIILPYYGTIDSHTYHTDHITNFTVSAFGADELVEIHHTKDQNETDIYLLKNDTYLSTGDVYSWPGHETSLFWEKQRFLFFAKCIAESLEHLPFSPTVLHLNDWHTGLAAKLLQLNNNPIPTVFTIHNLGYQGAWDAQEVLSLLGLTTEDFAHDTDQQIQINPLLLGIQHSDAITTVSPTYAQEILTTEYGEGLETHLAKHTNKLHGVLNGIDINRFDPSTDSALVTNYSKKTLADKTQNKTALQKEYNLTTNETIPIIGVVSRLVEQKGIDLLISSIPALAELDVQFVVLGTGDPQLEKQLTELSEKHSSWLSTHIAFDAQLAQRIYAGCDMFVIPSRYEPCGLTQMIAMRYGTVPIVRKTGGLADTVTQYNEAGATGFVFEKADSNDLCAILQTAISTYRNNPDQWKQLQENGMDQDFSWSQSAAEYIQIYTSLRTQ